MASRRRSFKEPGLPQFRSFCLVCRRGGYAAAARELMLTTPAVWEQVRSLESHYGVRLLDRDGPGVRPTARGPRLLELLGPLLSGPESTREVLKQEGGALPARVRLVTNLRVLVEEVSDALRAFQGRFPGARLRVDYTGIEAIEPLVVGGEADVAFTLEPGPERPFGGDTIHEPAGDLDYLLVTPPRHSLARSRPPRLEDIVRHPLILGEPGAYSRQRVQEVLHRSGLGGSARVAAETSSDEYTLALVRAGLGVEITLGLPHGRLYQGPSARCAGGSAGRGSASRGRAGPTSRRSRAPWPTSSAPPSAAPPASLRRRTTASEPARPSSPPITARVGRRAPSGPGAA